MADLDDRQTLEQVQADPTFFVSGRAEPVCIGEFQHAPDLLFAIKAELNVDLRFGRHLLTGPTRYTMLPRAGQAPDGPM